MPRKPRASSAEEGEEGAQGESKDQLGHIPGEAARVTPAVLGDCSLPTSSQFCPKREKELRNWKERSR